MYDRIINISVEVCSSVVAAKCPFKYCIEGNGRVLSGIAKMGWMTKSMTMRKTHYLRSCGEAAQEVFAVVITGCSPPVLHLALYQSGDQLLPVKGDKGSSGCEARRGPPSQSSSPTMPVQARATGGVPSDTVSRTSTTLKRAEIALKPEVPGLGANAGRTHEARKSLPRRDLLRSTSALVVL